MLKLFGLDIAQCKTDYETIKASASEDFKKLTTQARIGSTDLHYDFLSEEGKNELDFILLHLHHQQEVSQVSLLSHLANILLIFHPAGEVYFILKHLVDHSELVKKKEAKEVSRLKWHVPSNYQEHS